MLGVDARCHSQDVSQHIRDWLINTLLPVGHRLHILDLAERLELSSTPIREALIRLSAEGLVQFKPREGFFTPKPCFGETRDLFETANLLTLGALRVHDRTGRRADFALAPVSLETVESDQTTKVTALIQEAFDGAIVQLAGNAVLDGMMDAVSGRMRLFRMLDAKDPTIAEERIGHIAAVADAICQGDLGKAFDRLNVHHISVMDRLAHTVERRILSGFTASFTLPSRWCSNDPARPINRFAIKPRPDR